MNAREFAVDALVRVEGGAYSNVVVPAGLRGSGLTARDRAFATDLVYGTLREQRRLDALIAKVADRPVARLDPPVRAALRVGTYQLLHGSPAHAAVGETVAVSTAARPWVRQRGAPARSPTPGRRGPSPRTGRHASRIPTGSSTSSPRSLGEGDALDALLAAGNRPAARHAAPEPANGWGYGRR